MLSSKYIPNKQLRPIIGLPRGSKNNYKFAGFRALVDCDKRSKRDWQSGRSTADKVACEKLNILLQSSLLDQGVNIPEAR